MHYAPAARLLNRSLVLRQKLALCASDGGAPLPLGLGVCKERQRHALPIGAALSRGACASCRAYVHDAVSVLRRTGMVGKPSDRDGCQAVGQGWL